MQNYERRMREQLGKLKHLEDRIEADRIQSPELPGGRIKIRSSHGYEQVYLCEEGTGKEHFVPQENWEEIRPMIQLNYEEKLFRKVKEMRKTLEHFLQKYDETALTGVYDGMSQGRKNLITPLVLSDQQAIEKWRLEHPGNQNEVPRAETYETQRGELVRSKSEKILADLFNSMGIPYIYETRLRLKNKEICPDFMLFNVKTRKSAYWEHFGRLDKPDYAIKNYVRISDYERSGYLLGEDVFFSMELDGRSLDVNLIRQKLEKWLAR